jgi:hypothetical protein
MNILRQMQAFAVHAEDPRPDAHAITEQQFAFVQIVRLDDEGTVAGSVLVLAADADCIEQHVGRVVEQHRVVGEVHMVVGVDPLGQNLAFVTLEGRRDGHRTGRCAASIVTG